MKTSAIDSSSKDPLSRDLSTIRRLGLRWQHLHFLWKVVTIGAALALLALPFYGFAIKGQRTWSYDQDLTAARQALAAGQDVKARDLSLGLLRREPEKNDALQIFMRAAEGVADPRLVGAAQGYLSLNTTDKADRLFAWEAICKQSPMGIAARTWFTIREDERADPDFLSHWLERLTTEGLPKEVAKVLAAHVNLEDPRIERCRLSMLAKSGTDESYRELQARLLDRLANHPDDGPLLLGVLDEIPQSALIPYFFTGLGDWLKARGGEPSVADQLRLARSEIAARPETADAILSRVTAAHAATDPLAVARLYRTLGHFDKAGKLLEPLVAKGDPEAFKLMAEVLERLDKVEQWDKLLETPPAGVSLPEILCDRAFIAARRGDERAQPKFEQEGLAAAELRNNTAALIQLARHATRRGMHTYATEIMVEAIRKGPAGPLPFFASISPVVESLALDRDESKLMDVLGVYRTLEPGNLNVVTQYLYLGCLIGNVTPARVLTELSPIREKTRSFQLDCTVALAHVLEGNSGEADRLTNDTSINWFDQVPAMRAIRAIILTETGSKEEAGIYMEDFPWDSLLPSETRVFRELLGESLELEEIDQAAKAEETEAAKAAVAAKQAERARDIEKSKQAIAAMGAKEAAKSDEDRIAEKAERAEKGRRVEQARQAKRAKEAEEIRLAKEAKAKEANESAETGDAPAASPQ